MAERFFGLMRVFDRPGYTQAAVETLAKTTRLDRVDLHGFYTETKTFTLEHMKTMATRAGLTIASWIEAPESSRSSFRVALAFMRAAADDGYDRCIWCENDVVYNSNWLLSLDALHTRVTWHEDECPIVWSQAINNNLPSINKIKRDGYILAHRSGKVAMMIDAGMVRSIPLLGPHWNQTKTADTIIDGFVLKWKKQPRFLWPETSWVDHVGRLGLSTRDEAAFTASRGIGFEPEPHVQEALAWLAEHEDAVVPTWLEDE